MKRRPSARLVACTALIFSCSLYASCSHGSDFAYSGTVQAESAAVGSTIGGRVVAVLVNTGDHVKGGQVLVRLDAATERAALAQAQAQLAQAQASLASIQAGSTRAQTQAAQAQTQQAAAGYRKAAVTSVDQVIAAQLAVRQAQANLDKAQAASIDATVNAGRIETLYSQGAVSAQARDAAIADAKQAQATVVAASAQVATAQSQLQATVAGAAPADVAAAQGAYEAAAANQRGVQINAPTQAQQARAGVDAASANVAAARSRLNEMIVRAPGDGVVQDLDLHAGDLVPPGVPIATVDEFRDPYARIFVPQRELSRVALGKAVRVRSDAIANTIFDGTVEAIDTSAQFTPQNVQTQEDRQGIDFGVKIRIHDPQRLVLAGTTVEVALP